MSLPRYPRYKDSGVEWLGEVPGHWEVIPLKHLAKFINGDAFKPTEWAESGTPIIRIQNLNGGEEFNYFDGDVEPRYLVHDGDLLFGWSGNRGTSFGPFLWRRNEVCALNQHIFRVVPTSICKQTLYWTLKAVTVHVEDQAHGIIGMVHITKGALGAINVPIPPDQEHQRLAVFLDQETAKIDALVEEQRRLIELLEEKRQAVISHAVTKGLNPDAPMKHSGVEWLGEVPAHWESMQLRRFVTSIEQGWSPQAEDREPECDEWGVLKLNAVKRGRFDASKAKALFAEGKVPVGLAVQAGDFLLTRANTPELVGESCYVDEVKSRLIFSDLIYRINLESSRILGQYLNLFLQTPLGRSQVEADARGSSRTMVKISHEHILNWITPLPPASEQMQIFEAVQQEQRRIDILTASATHAIELLQERRTALISAAVTGKIDVRGLATEDAA